MASYERKILNTLLDSYENSLLSSGKNKVAVHIAFPFTEQSMPEYFDLSSSEYEKIHACLKELEEKGFITVSWRDKKPGGTVQKVILQEEQAKAVYRYLKRTPKAVYSAGIKALLLRLQPECRTPAASAFIIWLLGRLEADRSVKEYFDIKDEEKANRLVRCVAYVEENDRPCYYREFSIRHFGNSKAFEEIKGTVKKVLCRFGNGPEDADEKAVFAEYGIYDTPDYVYLKGEGLLCFPGLERGTVLSGPGSADLAASGNDKEGPVYADGSVSSDNRYIRLSDLSQGIGICGEDLERIHIYPTDHTQKVISIENLTTFFRWQEADSLIIYLGGYHNRTRRRLLGMIHEQLPHARYLHFGDIDIGGFEIYEDLCKKTGIPFELYHMGIRELKKYGAYTRPLTANDKKRLQRLLDEGRGSYQDVLTYMYEHDAKLEQECIEE